MKYFLIIYDRRAGELRELEEFDSSSRDEALRVRFERETEERGNPDIEVVMLGSPSRETLEKTHTRYFTSVRDLAKGLS